MGIESFKWPFRQPPFTEAIITRQVLEEGLPIKIVTHFAEDDSWHFSCGTTTEYHDEEKSDLGQILELDSSIAEIANLRGGSRAKRAEVGAEWIRERL